MAMVTHLLFNFIAIYAFIFSIFSSVAKGNFALNPLNNEGSLEFNLPIPDPGDYKGGGNISGKEDSNFLNGKTLTEVKIHANGSLIPSGNEKWDSLVKELLNQNKETESVKSVISSNTIPENGEKEKPNLKEKPGNYYCIKCNNYKCENFHYCQGAAQCFQARIRDATGTETYSRGCINQEEQTSFVCTSSIEVKVEAFAVKCCEGNLCNNETFPEIPHPSDFESNDGMAAAAKVILYVVLGTLALSALIIAAIFLVTRRKFTKFHFKYMKDIPSMTHVDIYRDEPKFNLAGNSSLVGPFTDSLTSGSGSGLPLFMQRTLAKNITLEDMIGKGRYGEVWKGVWHGETVAVKIFFSRDESSWLRETEIYSSVLLRHANILGFYGSDMTSNASSTQLWLVTHYCPRGSLFDYLQTHSFNNKELKTVCLSIINGLLHLHTEIMGTQGKPAIAHRNISSRNIIVRNDGSCCIADLGLAVVRPAGTEDINIGNMERLPTIRYMSPEVLDASIDMDVFDNFRKVDMYAVAIVIWEACQKSDYNGVFAEYQLPFGNLVPAEPSIEDMRNVVCIQRQRPIIPKEWENDSVLNGISNIIKECWHHNPNVRLTALRVKKNLGKVLNNDLVAPALYAA